jgi:hypothetical protein
MDFLLKSLLDHVNQRKLKNTPCKSLKINKNEKKYNEL